MKLLVAPFFLLFGLFSTLAADVDTPQKNPITDGGEAFMVWGDIKVESNKIVSIKKPDFVAALTKPIAVSLSEKDAKLEAATINIYPYSGDPILIYLTADAFTPENIAEMQPKINWGTKVFFENVTVNIKGKSKKLSEVFSLKLI